MLQLYLLQPMLRMYYVLYTGKKMACVGLRGSMKTLQANGDRFSHLPLHKFLSQGKFSMKYYQKLNY